MERLTIRQIAERLAITPDAARMKARREAKKGRWQIIPGNHPQDPVHVELPTEDLPATPPERSPPRRTLRHPTAPNALAEMLVAELGATRARADQLAERLLEATAAHGATAAQLAATRAELEAAAGYITELQALVRKERARSWWQRLLG